MSDESQSKEHERATASSDVNAGESSSQPMIGQLIAPSFLIEAYEGNPLPGFIPGIKYLAVKYHSMRQVIGDGNCFYRAFLFAYLEQLHSIHISGPTASVESEISRFRDIVVNSKELLVSIGYDEFTFEYFLDSLVELLDALFTLTNDELLSKFQADGESDSYTWFMRLLTALSLRREPDRYLPFIQDTLCFDIDSFCRQEVEPMGRECDQMQIIAVASILGLQFDVEYLDGKAFNEANGLSVVSLGDLSDVSEELKPLRRINLLYRPGHYDILYKSSR